MANLLASSIARIATTGQVTPQDVHALCAIVSGDGPMSVDDADAICQLNRTCDAKCAEWREFCLEALTTWLVDQGDTAGHVDAAKAAWLIAQIDRNGVVETVDDLLLLVLVLEKASTAPDALKAYALGQIENIILTGKGPTRMGTTPRPFIVEEAEVALMRRIFFPESDAPAISNAEADVLARIKQATGSGDNASSWARLFVRLVGSYLMAFPGSHALTAAHADELNRFIQDHMPNVDRFLGRLEAALGSADAAASAGQGMTAHEARWLKLHIASDSELDDIEKALLAFIIDESTAPSADIADADGANSAYARRA